LQHGAGRNTVQSSRDTVPDHRDCSRLARSAAAEFDAAEFDANVARPRRVK